MARSSCDRTSTVVGSATHERGVIVVTPLRILLVEDAEDDGELILREVRRGGYDPVWKRVETEPELRAALTEAPWDLITCDWVMPRFNAPAALSVIRDHSVDAPIVIVSGEVGEEFAVKALKGGACDFVSKRRLARLVSVIERELRDASARRALLRAEEALRASQQRLQLAVEASNTGLWDWFPYSTTIYFSRQWKAQLGYEEHEVANDIEEWWSRLHPEDHARVLATATACLENQTGIWETEYRLRHKDGTYRWIASRATLLRDDTGEVCRILGAHFDVTKLKQTQEALRASEQRYRSIVETSHDLIWSVDAVGRITFVSAAVRRLGQQPEKFVGLPFSDFRSPEEATRQRRAFERLMAGETVLDYEVEVVTKDGTPALYSFNATPLLDNFGNVIGATGTAVDMTERKRVETELRASKARLEKYIDRVSDMIVTVDGSGRITSANPIACQLTGYASEELLGAPIWKFVAPEMRADIESQFRRILEGER
ncbi:MAG: PAS domain S-box protein, partial [Deltaproteobacteria bacterium]|nr:PAS domain S-box protein [Deltaproteobacteria bacterium]